MAFKKILTVLIVLVTAITLQSQNAKTDTSKVPYVPVIYSDSSGIEKKIDSINTDTYKTAIRVQRKANRLVVLSQQSRMQQQLRSRIKISVSEIPIKELPVSVDSVKVDPPVIPVKHKFLFWRR